MPAKVGIQSQGVECKMCNAYCCQGALLMASCNPNLVSMAWNGTHSSVSLLPQRNTLTSHKQAAGVRWHSEHPLKFGFCQPSCLQLRSRQPTLSGRCQPSSDHPCSSKTQPAAVFFLFTSLPLTVGVPQLCGFGILQGIPCPAKATPKGFSLARGEAVKESLNISIGFLWKASIFSSRLRSASFFGNFKIELGLFKMPGPFARLCPFAGLCPCAGLVSVCFVFFW